MNCLACSAANPDVAKFCLACGTPFPRSCPRCCAKLPTASKFCLECGLALGAPRPVVEASAPTPTPAVGAAAAGLAPYLPRELHAKLEAVRAGNAMVGERRVVTMLFCDVKGSTAAAERLDPEDWAEIMNGAFERLISPVYRYEGTLARLMGDAVLAFFGAPIAHEDDPQRAILAGLAMVHEIDDYASRMQRRWGIDLAVRVGINTGLVVVGEVGSDMRLEYTAMGDAVNVAARMEQTAAPGTVRVSGSTFKLVAPLFDAEELGEVAVKGKEQPVTAYRVLHPKVQPGRLRGIEGLDAPMIGRDRELSALRGHVEALGRGQGSIVSILGEAGLGKSRLLQELRGAVGADSAALTWCEGRSLSYQTGTPFAPFIDLLGAHLGLRGDGSSTYAQLRETLVGGLGEAARDDAPPLASLLGIAIDDEVDADKVRYLAPPDLRRRIEIAVVDTLERTARRRPTLLVLEDLHWADPSSLELLLRLLPVTDRTALMLVALYRPRRQEESWKLHETAARDFEHRYHAVHLEPLEDADARRLVASLLHVEGLPASIREQILAKAEGNPYFVEEIIRALIDAGAIVKEGDDWRATRAVESIPVPDTLAGVLTTRLDRLDEAARRVVQTASVLGREFAYDALAAVVEPASALEDTLTELQRRGLVRERARLPSRQYAFKHVLVQEVAYSTLLLKSRRELHRRVGDALSRLAPGQPAEIARHYLEAQDEVLALPWLVAAGEQAARAYSTAEAIERFDRAIAIVLAGAREPGLAARAFEGRGSIAMMRADVPGALANYEAMRRLGEDGADEPLQVAALNKLALIQGLFLGDLPAGAGLLDRSQELAERAGCVPGLAEQCMIRCAIHVSGGEFERAYQYLDRATTLGHELQADEPVLFGLTHISNTLVELTEYDRAWPKIREALALAEGKGNRKYLAELKGFAVPQALLRDGDVEAALRSAREGAAMAEEIGHAFGVASGAGFLGAIATAQGRFEDAIADNERALHAGRACGMPFLETMSMCALGSVYRELGERLVERAKALHREALARLDMPLGMAFAGAVYGEVGFCALSLGALDEAQRCFDEGLRHKSATMYLTRPQLLTGAGLVALAQGRREDAVARAHEARAFAEPRAMKHALPLVGLLEALLADAAGRADEAIERFGQVEAAAAALGFRPLVWKTCVESARLLAATGRAADADAHRSRGRDVVRQIAAEIGDESLRAGYVGTALAALGAAS